MQKIELNELKEKLNDLSSLVDEEGLIISEDAEEKYVLISADFIDELMEVYQSDLLINPLRHLDAEDIDFKIVGDNKLQLSEKEYDQLRQKMMNAFDEFFKKNIKKMN